LQKSSLGADRTSPHPRRRQVQRGELAGSLRADGLEVIEAATAEHAIEVLRATPVHGVLCTVVGSGWSCSG